MPAKKTLTVGRVLFGLLVLLGTFILLNPSQQHQPPPKVSNESDHPHVPIPRSLQEYILDQNLLLSREYSFKLNKTSLQPRSQKIAQFLQLATKAGGFHPPEDGGSVTHLRLESGATKFRSVCKSLSEAGVLRFRKYVRGPKAGNTTVDLKSNLSLKENQNLFADLKLLADDTLGPSRRYEKYQALDKLEQDYHICSQKFSREVRLEAPDSALEFSTCADVQKVFPSLGISAPTTTISYGPISLWWVHSTKFEHLFEKSDHTQVPVQVEMTFTLQYFTTNQAITSQEIDEYYGMGGEYKITTTKSEFSFRIWSPNHGKSLWDPEILESFTHKFEKIKEATSDYDAETECN